MSFEYSVTYNTENDYENPVENASWQFLIVPENNDTQELVGIEIENSLGAKNEFSQNGYGFQTIRINTQEQFQKLNFRATFILKKTSLNPFGQVPIFNILDNYELAQSLDFKVDFEQFLGQTKFTTLPQDSKNLFVFDTTLSIFDNLQKLNNWVYFYIHFNTGVTHVNTLLEEIINNRAGVCQDFTHLFCALARANNIPARYVSGYLHQGNGYFGDAQMHAWAEVYVPQIGWMGFDPTNNILVDDNHLKVAHGKDFKDCSPLKGVVYSQGDNKTVHSVEVQAQQ
ncbi:transglutaminase family protein [Arenibacter sp. F20364]|uniref:transglutaminase-like domain-containing protein n=1 Tax=Arenibacter sp. F20364 TaxID=2926415 RepID=UPI001FF42384|nr:transglutaminase family protein [Arenibacter sp. F20364]MCK0189315.1 transglutaminase family protein [Arenibacter sp. F20364]